MKSHNFTLIETARTLAFQHAMQMDWTYADWALAISKRRTNAAILRRRELTGFLRRMGFSLPVIGAVFNRDHSSVFNIVGRMPTPGPVVCGPGYHTTEVGAL